jgi:hypothetical protein
MEQNQDTSLFGINVDQAGKSHLADTAKWAKFLAVFGFIICGLIVIIGIFFGSFFSMFSSQLGGDNPYSDIGGSPGFGSAMGSAMAIIYVIMALIYFFPCLYLFRFATKMKTALASNDQLVLNTSFQNLKAAFRFVGILTIIGMAFWLLAIIVGLLGAATGGSL